MAEPESAIRHRRKVRVGLVVSDKMDKTVVVQIEELRPHRIYRKVLRQQRRLQAHDEHNQAHAGDRVRVMETRPLSRSKRWRVVEVVEKAR